MSSDALCSLIDFENRDAIFQGVHRSYKFTLLTIAGVLRKAEKCLFVFFAHSVDDLSDASKRITMSFKDIATFNPISKTCPVLRTSKDFALLKALHAKGCLLESSEWGGYYIRLVHLDDHKERVLIESDLAEGSFDKFNDFVTERDTYRRVHEPKLIHLYDHRYATFASTTTADIKQGQTALVSEKQHSDVDFTFKPRYWVTETFFRAILEKYPTQNGWLIGYRDIARSTDVRTCIACAIPRTPATVSMPCLGVAAGRPKALLLANLASYCLDYAVRLKVPGTHLTYGIMKQLPLLPPTEYQTACPWHPEETIDKWVISRVAELSYTAWDMKPFAEDLGYAGEPFIWNDDRRFQLRCELDAAFFHLYGISEADVDYIMETFPIVKAKDIQAHGTFRTKETILRLYREYARPKLTSAQFDMLKAMAYVAAFVQAWKKRVESGILETGLVLMVDDALRNAYLTGTPIRSRQSGRHHAKLIDWMPLAVNQLLSKDAIKIDPKSPEGLPFYIVGPSPFDLTNLGDYVKKAEEAAKVIKKIGEQKARTEVEECIDDLCNLVPI